VPLNLPNWGKSCVLNHISFYYREETSYLPKIDYFFPNCFSVITITNHHDNPLTTLQHTIYTISPHFSMSSARRRGAPPKTQFYTGPLKKEDVKSRFVDQNEEKSDYYNIRNATKHIKSSESDADDEEHITKNVHNDHSTDNTDNTDNIPDNTMDTPQHSLHRGVKLNQSREVASNTSKSSSLTRCPQHIPGLSKQITALSITPPTLFGPQHHCNLLENTNTLPIVDPCPPPCNLTPNEDPNSPPIYSVQPTNRFVTNATRTRVFKLP